MNLIIGYGNTLRSDDGVGPFVAHQFAMRFPAVNVLTPHQLLPELVEPISDAQIVVFVDASVEGRVGQVTVQPVCPSANEDAFSHNVTPAGLLAGAQSLFGGAPDAWLVTITGEDFTLGETLSEPVHAAVPGILEKITHLLYPPR